MKIIFYGPSPEIEEITQDLGDHEVHIFEDAEKLKEAVGKDEALIILNLDFNKNEALALCQRYSSKSDVRRILISKNSEMENENIPCTAGIFGEYDADKLKFIVKENAVSHDETLEKDIQDAFNMAFGEEEAEEVPAMEVKEEAEAEVKSEVDSELDLELGEASEAEGGLELGDASEAEGDLELGDASEPEGDLELGSEPEPAPAGETHDSYSVVDEESDLTFDLGIGPDEVPAAEEKVEEVVAEAKAVEEAVEDIEVGTELELGGEATGDENIAESSGDLDLGEDLSRELELGAIEESIEGTPEMEDVGDLDLDLGEDLDIQASEETPSAPDMEDAGDLDLDVSASEETPSAPEPEPEAQIEPEMVEEVNAEAPAEPDVPVEFTVEIPNLDEEIASSTSTEVVGKEEKAEDESLQFEAKEIVEEEAEAKVEEKVEEEVKESEIPAQEVVSKERVVYQYDDNALVRLEATIRQLREEREEFLKEIEKFNIDKNVLEGDNLGLRSEVEELRVEVGLLKKRNLEEREDYSHDKKILQDSLLVSEQKIKTLEDDIERLSQRAHIDMGKIRQKERELEGQLELLTMDSENQINNREQKILELKRKVDAIEFNMENVGGREAKIREEKLKVEEKLNKVMKSMRSSIKFLEEELETEPEFLREIKKEAA